MKKFIALFLLFVGWLGAQEITKVGNAGAKFLNIGLTPRAMGMGEAYVAVANDVSSVFWNPAGPANLKGDALFVGYTNWVADIKVPAVAYSKDLHLMGRLTFLLSGLSVTGMQEAIVDEDPNTPELTGKEFSYTAGQFGVGYSKYFTDKFAAGVVVKGLYEGYGDWTSTKSFAIDAGTYFWTGFKTLRVAMSLQHLGADMKPSGTYKQLVLHGAAMDTLEYEYRSYPLPMTFRVGVAMEVLENKDMKLTVATEAVHPTDNAETIAFGAEFTYRDMLQLRAGYRLGDRDSYLCGLGMGVGVKVGKIAVDYSFSDMRFLPDVHRIGITYNF